MDFKRLMIGSLIFVLIITCFSLVITEMKQKSRGLALDDPYFNESYAKINESFSKVIKTQELEQNDTIKYGSGFLQNVDLGFKVINSMWDSVNIIKVIIYKTADKLNIPPVLIVLVIFIILAGLVFSVVNYALGRSDD